MNVSVPECIHVHVCVCVYAYLHKYMCLCVQLPLGMVKTIKRVFKNTGNIETVDMKHW